MWMHHAQEVITPTLITSHHTTISHPNIQSPSVLVLPSFIHELVSKPPGGGARGKGKSLEPPPSRSGWLCRAGQRKMAAWRAKSTMPSWAALPSTSGHNNPADHAQRNPARFAPHLIEQIQSSGSPGLCSPKREIFHRHRKRAS